MNKNLKTILLGIFTLIASTEMMYPIIFTGPARRNANRQKQQQAYAAGMAGGSTEGLMAGQEQENNSDVEVQMFSGDNPDAQEDDAMEVDSHLTDNESNDDTISVASGDESDNESENENPLDISFMVASDDENDSNSESGYGYGYDLLARGQAQEQARQEAIAGFEYDNYGDNPDRYTPQQFSDYLYDPNFVSPIQPDSENVAAVDESLEDAGLNNDDIDRITVNLFGNDSDSDDDDDVVSQSIEPEVKDSATHDDAQAEHVASDVQTKEVPAQPVATPALLAAPSEKTEEAHEEVEPTPVQPAVAVEPAPVAAPIIAPVQEQVKIIKVYPVYDAVRSAVKAINNATHDMINYIYSFVK